MTLDLTKVLVGATTTTTTTASGGAVVTQTGTAAPVASATQGGSTGVSSTYVPDYGMIIVVHAVLMVCAPALVSLSPQRADE